MRKLLRRLALAGIALGALLALGVVALVRTDRGQAWTASILVRVLQDATGARVSVQRVSGNLWSGAELTDVTIRFHGGTIIRVPRMRASYSLARLVVGGLRFDTVELDDVHVRLVRRGGDWGFVAPGVVRPPTTLPVLRVGRVRIDGGRLAVAILDGETPRRFGATAIAFDGSFGMDPEWIEVTVASLGLVPRGLPLTPLEATGQLRLDDAGGFERAHLGLRTRASVLAAAAAVDDDELGIRLRAPRLAAREVAALVPGFDLRADAAVRLTVEGPRRALAASAFVDFGPAGAVRGRARIDAADDPWRWEGSAQLRHLDPAAIVAGPPPAHLDGTVELSGRGADEATRVAYRFALHDSTLAGRRLRQVRLAGHLGLDGLDGRGNVALDAGHVRLHARAAFTKVPSLRARAAVAFDDLAALVPGVPGAVTGRVRVTGEGVEDATRRIDVHAHVTSAHVRGVPLTDATLAAEVRGRRLEVTQGTVDGPGVRAELHGSGDIHDQTLEAAATATLALDRLGQAAGMPLAGTATVQADVRGRIDALDGHVTASGDGLRRADLHVRAARVDADVRGLGGAAPSATVSLQVTDAGVTDATGSVALRASLAQAPHGVRGALTSLTLEPPRSARWMLVRPTRFALDGGVQVDALVLASNGQRVTLTGRAGATGPADATLTLADITLAPWCALAGTVPCEGTVSGTARLTGTAAAPRLSGQLEAIGLVLDDIRPGRVTGRIAYADRTATVGARLDGDLGTARGTAAVPVDLAWAGSRQDRSAAPVDVQLDADRLDLRLLRVLAPTAIRRSEGTASASIHLTGPWGRMRPNGTLTATAPTIELVGTGVPYREVRLQLRLTPAGVVVEEAFARSGDGTLDASGDIAIAAARPEAFALRVRLTNFLAVRTPAYAAAVAGTLDVGGTLGAPRVTGSVEVTHAVLRPSVLPAGDASLDPDPTIEVVGLPPVPEDQREPPPPGLWHQLALDVTVRIVRDVWIRRSDADIEVRGEVRLQKATGEPLRPTGTIRLVRGWYAFQGRRFNLEEGNVILTGESPPDPHLDVTATYRVSPTSPTSDRDYVVTVRLGGTLERPTLTLSSDPPLEQSDILAVLLFGRPARDLDNRDRGTLQQQAVSLASGYVAPELRESVMETFNLDTFELGAQAVRAGRYVTSDVFLSLAQEFGPRAAQVVSVEYALTRRLALKLSTSSLGTSALDLLWQRRY